jgi:hypothetical protein
VDGFGKIKKCIKIIKFKIYIYYDREEESKRIFELFKTEFDSESNNHHEGHGEIKKFPRCNSLEELIGDHD